MVEVENMDLMCCVNDLHCMYQCLSKNVADLLRGLHNSKSLVSYWNDTVWGKCMKLLFAFYRHTGSCDKQKIGLTVNLTW